MYSINTIVPRYLFLITKSTLLYARENEKTQINTYTVYFVPSVSGYVNELRFTHNFTI